MKSILSYIDYNQILTSINQYHYYRDRMRARERAIRPNSPVPVPPNSNFYFKLQLQLQLQFISSLYLIVNLYERRWRKQKSPFRTLKIPYPVT